jgi:hypothetical protein
MGANAINDFGPMAMPSLQDALAPRRCPVRDVSAPNGAEARPRTCRPSEVRDLRLVALAANAEHAGPQKEIEAGRPPPASETRGAQAPVAIIEAAGSVEHFVENVAVATGGDEGLLRAEKPLLDSMVAYGRACEVN